MTSTWKVALVATAASLLPTAALAAPKPAKHCVLQKYAELDVSYENNKILVPVSIDGESLELPIDLASGVSYLSRDFPDRHHLQVVANNGPYSESYLNSTPLRGIAVVPDLVMGGYTLSRAAFLTLSDADANARPAQLRSISSALGMDIFRNVDVEIDLPHDKIRLYAPSDCGRAAVYWDNAPAVVVIQRGQIGDPYFILEMDGRKMRAKFQTQSADSSLSTDVTKRLYGWDENSPGVQTEPLPGANPDNHEVGRYRAMKMTGGGLTITNANVRLTSAPAKCELTVNRRLVAGYGPECGNVVPLKIGMTVVKQLRLYMSAKEELMYISAVEPPAPQKP